MSEKVEIDREELARLRADSAELARVRGVTVISTLMIETAEAARFASHLVGNQVHLDPNKHYRIDFVVLGEPEEIKQSIPEGFALVPVEPTDGCRVEAGFEVIDRKHIPTVTIKMPPISAEDSKGWDRRDKVAQAIRAMLAAAPKGDSHE